MDRQVENSVTQWIIPFVIASILVCGMLKQVPLFDCFCEGAKTGLDTAWRMVTPLVGLLVAISMLRASGAMEMLTSFLHLFTGKIGVPKEVLPLAFMRPISGSGALAIVGELLQAYGPDSFIGRSASVMMGSTETTFYTLAVYFGAAKIVHTRYTLPAALAADVTGILVSVWICRFLGF